MRTACAYVILSTLCNGATLVLSSPVTLAEVANTCTIWITTPSILSAMDPTRGYKDVKWIIMGGESPTPSLIKNWSIPNRKLINAYGPTEATCVVSMAELLPGAPITMGWPLSYCKVLLIDADDNEADEGELLLGGPGIAVGYFGDEELTRRTFVRRGSQGEVFYRTKDYARRTADGFVFCGRKDGVVKNRGFLVNLDSEVEPAIISSSGDEPSAKVQQCAAIKSPEGSLVGFVCPESAAEGLRERMLEHYSAFLVPDTIHGIDFFALTANGKIDRKALVALHEKTQLPQFLNADIFLQHVRDQGKSITPLEAVRHGICTVLRVVQARVGDHASFRALGGHSLNAVMLVSTLRKLGFLTDVASIYSEDTVAAIASVLKRTDFDPGEVCSLEATETDRTGFREALASSTRELDDMQIFPATDMQTRMVRGTVGNPTMNFLKIGMTFDHPGVNHAAFLQALRQSWSALVRKHSILRTSFRLDSLSEPVQVLDEAYNIQWQEESVDSEAEWNVENDTTARFEPGELMSFDERDAHALSRVRVFSLPGIKSRVVWSVHHALIDGWSATIVLHDLWELLRSTHEAKAPCPQFSDAAWCLRKLARRDSGTAKAFWKELLQAHSQGIPRLRIPPPSTEALKPQPQSESHRKLSVRMSQMIDAAKERGVTTAALVYSAWAILLSRYCDSKAVVLGAVLSGRSLPLDGVEKIIGPLVNTLPLPAAVDPDMAVTEFLQQTFLSLCRLLDFQWTPNSLIQEATGFRGTEYYDTLLAIQYDFPASEWPEHEQRLCSPPYDVSYAETTEMPLTIMLDVVDGFLDARFLYHKAIFSGHMVERMMGHFENILIAFLEACFEDPRQFGHTVGGISDKMLGRQELEERLNCTGQELEEPYQGPETLPEALEASFKSHRDLHAVEGLNRSLTYGELDDATARTSKVLAAYGAKPGEIVCVIADGSVEWLLAIMAVVRTGAAYCPVDHKLPWERQKYMMSACSPPMVLFSNISARKGSPGFENVPVLLDVETILSVDGLEDLPNDSGEGKNDILLTTHSLKSDEVAVVIFTSGSTGFPKAVQLQHKGILSLLSHAPARLYSKPGQRNAQLLSLGFDCCVKEVFASLLYGATLVLKDTSDPLAHLSKVDATVGTPSLISSLDPVQYPNLKILTLVGETLPSVLVQKWLPGRMIQNGYAPAECTLIATAQPLQPNTPISIGKPVPRMNFYLLDSTGRPVPAGVTGEIHISGVQVTPGYLNNAQETKARFLADPFREGWTMFRTGDMGRWLESGDIEYIGRNDNQVKVRGFRLDLGDVEASILRVAGDIDNVAVVVTGGSLRAFVTPETVATEQLLQTLRQHLPDYSTPNTITALKELPVSRNGKVDRTRLSEMRLERDSGVEPLVSETERDVATVWAELLGRDLVEDPIGASDGFFAIGGHSLLQIRLAQRLSKLWEIKVPLRVIIRHQVLRDLCRAIDGHLDREQDGKASGQQVLVVEGNNSIKRFADTQKSMRSERTKASYLEQEMILNQLLCGGSPIWNIVYSCNAYGPLEIQHLATAYRRTLEKHEVLRSRFHIEDDGTMTRSIFPAREATLQNHSCDEENVGEFISKTAQRPMDPFKEPLFQIHTASITPWKTTIIVVISHVIGDGPTLHHALSEISAEYSRPGTEHGPGNLKASVSLPESTPNYLDWSSWAADALLSPPTDDTASFWKSHLSSPDARQPLGTLPQAHSYRGRTRTWTVRPEHHRRLSALSLGHGITMHQLALGATFLALQSLQARPAARGGPVTVALGAPMTMRTEVGTEDMLGMLLDRLVVPLTWDFGAPAGGATPGGSNSLGGFLSMVGGRGRAALGRFVPHRVLRDILRGGGGNAADRAGPSLASPLFQVMVSFHTAVETAGGRLSLQGVETVEREDGRPMCAKFPVMVEFTDKGSRGLQVELECADGALDEERADRLENALALVLELLGAGVSIDGIMRAIDDATVRQGDGLPTPQSEREEFDYRHETKGKAGSMGGDDRASIIKEAVSECLGRPMDDSNDSETFWELGANSMDALVLQKLCEKKGVDLDLRAMFETPNTTAW